MTTEPTKEPSGAARLFGDFAPALVEFGIARRERGALSSLTR